MARIFENPEHWRTRAEEARTIADDFDNPETKRVMLAIAGAYEDMAERAEQRRELAEDLTLKK